MDKKERINNIVARLNEANQAYRAGDELLMSDYDFDKLEDLLRKMDPHNSWFKNGVNDPTPKDREYKLPFPMMSLNKVKTISDVISWMDRFPESQFVITPKFDGLSVGMSNTKSWTRGDGSIGQICTEHLSNTANKPYVDKGEIIRGEIIIERSDWGRFLENHPGAKSPRNSATGLINGDFDKEKLGDYSLLTVMPYSSLNVTSNKDEELERIGADYEYAIVSRNEITEDKLNQLFFKWSQKYPIDGIVIDVNEAEYRNGTEANGNPSYTIAYKHHTFSEVGESTVSKIELGINRDGILTPVVHIQPELTLAGATISKVNGINMRYINDWKIFPGEKVRIVRSGEVIPKIVAVGNQEIPFRDNCPSQSEYNDRYGLGISARMDEYKGPWTVKELEYCPFCGEKLQKDGSIDDYVNYKCVNDECVGKKEQAVFKFFEICGLDGFKEAKFKQLIKCGIIGYDIFDSFRLKRADLEGLEGWADKSINDFLERLKTLRNGSIPFARFLHATGYFEDLGEKTIQNIIDNIDDIDSYKFSDLLKIDGVQDVTAYKFTNGINRYKKDRNTIEDLFTFSNFKTKVNEATGPLSGKIICLTGFRDKVLSQKILELGGTVLDSFTKSVNLLLVKDPSSTSSKVVKAKKLGVEILSRNEFIEKYDIK